MLSPDETTLQTITRFLDAFNAGDVDAIMRAMTDDCVFENTYPAPDGSRFEGAPAVRAFWEQFFRDSRRPHFEVEEIFGHAERCVARWTYSWQNDDGSPGHVRGVDLYRLRDGLVQEKLSYVKG